MICAHEGGEPCLDPTPHCGFCGIASEGGRLHPECRERHWAEVDRRVLNVLRRLPVLAQFAREQP